MKNEPFRELGSSDLTSRPSWIHREPRLAIIGWVFLIIIGLYLIRLWQLQFLESGSWKVQAEQQQTKSITLSPSRGVIFDREGHILVRNVPAYNVVVTPGELPDDEDRERAVLQRLASLIDVPYSTTTAHEAPPYQRELNCVGRDLYPPYGERPRPGLLEMVNEVRWLEPYKPIIVAHNVDRELALLIAQEGGLTMPGVGVQIISRRNYIYGKLTAQILGFLGPIPPQHEAEYKARGYNINTDRIGYNGVELEAEDTLRGTPGRRMVEKDVLGKQLRVLSEIPPQPGDNVYLTLDTELQKVADEALRAGLKKVGSRRGVVVALDPRDGEVLALVSLPTYDDNMFSKKLDEKAYQALLEDPHLPFFNHAIADQVPPGSIFKVIPATAGLNEGIINRYTTLDCPGRMLLPNKFAPDNPQLAQPFYCWIYLHNGGGHGPLNVVDAIAQSCDIFFYKLGGGYPVTHFEGLGVDRIDRYAKMFGLGEPTGIDLPGEAAGLVPSPKWKRVNYHETWTTGNTYNLSIGQGDLLVTPLQMANVMAAVANGGTLYQPQIIHHVTDIEGHVVHHFTPKVIRKLDVDAAIWQIIHEGLVKAVADGGTGYLAQLKDLGITVAGKTGTAEYCDDLAYKAGRCNIIGEKQTLPTHAGFMAYAPAEAPELVVIAWVYDGGEGSMTSAPIVHDVMHFYFARKLGKLDEQESAAAPMAGNPHPR